MAVEEVIADVEQRRTHRGRYASPYDLHSRYAAAAEVLRFADGAHPETVSTRRFDTARRGAGHPDLARADQLARSVGRSWPEFRAAALSETTDESRSYGARHKDPPRRSWLTKSGAVAIVGRVAEAMGCTTLTEGEFDAYRDAFLEHTKEPGFVFPTADQVKFVCGGWLPALLFAHLDAPESGSPEFGLPIRDALSLFLTTQGWLPGRNHMERFAADERWSFPLGGLTSQRWQGHLRSFRRYWVGELNRWAPAGPPAVAPPIVPLPDALVARLPRQGRPPKNYWTYERVLECVNRYFAATEAAALKQAPYRAWAKQQNAMGVWTAPPSRFPKYGTLAELAVAARERRNAPKAA